MQGDISIGARPASPGGVGREAVDCTTTAPVQHSTTNGTLRDGCSLDFSDLEASFDAMLASSPPRPSSKGRATSRHPRKRNANQEKADEGRSLSDARTLTNATVQCTATTLHAETRNANLEKPDGGRSPSEDLRTAEAVNCCRWDRSGACLAAFEIVASFEPEKAAETRGKDGGESAHIQRLIADYEAEGNDSCQVGSEEVPLRSPGPVRGPVAPCLGPGGLLPTLLTLLNVKRGNYGP